MRKNAPKREAKGRKRRRFFKDATKIAIVIFKDFAIVMIS